MEVFSPQLNCFLPIQLRLPESTACVLFVHNNFLVVHSEHYISTFAGGQAEQLVPITLNTTRPMSKYSNSPPMVVPTRDLYFLIQSSKIRSFNLVTGEEVQRFNLD